MRRGRWAVVLQLVLWVLLAPPLVLVVAGLQGLPRFAYVLFLAACAIALYFFNFKSCESNVDAFKKFVIYLMVMTVFTLIAGAVYLMAAFIFVMKKGM